MTAGDLCVPLEMARGWHAPVGLAHSVFRSLSSRSNSSIVDGVRLVDVRRLRLLERACPEDALSGQLTVSGGAALINDGERVQHCVQTLSTLAFSHNAHQGRAHLLGVLLRNVEPVLQRAIP